MRTRVGIFGGSFNPPHLGHMRLAVEVMEALRPARLDFLPSARPPHKGGRRILPFALRLDMLRAATAGMRNVAVNDLEGERDELSYTADTLRIYRRREPGRRFFFILGTEDFAVINTWYDWRTLPYLADIVVVPRSGMEVEAFADAAREFWPEAEKTAPETIFSGRSVPVDAAFRLPEEAGGGLLLHLPLPRLDIRAELIRERLLAGRCVRFLVPDAVHDLLLRDPKTVEVWRA